MRNDNSSTSQPIQVFSHVEIDGGLITGPIIIESERGIRAVPTLVGSYRYFVAVVENDGGKVTMWDGDSHACAVEEANSLKYSFSVGKIVDLTGEAA